VAASKLFTPSQRHPDGCFVNPFTAPEGPGGFADGTDGGAPYPLRLGGGAKRGSLMPPSSPFKSLDDFDQEK
jgi:hypothetical protein